MVCGQHRRHPRPTSRSSRPPSPRESAVVVPDRLPRPLGHRPLVACPADGKAWRVGAAVWEVGRWLPRCRIAAATARARCSISARPSTMKASRRSVTIPRICRWRRAADGQHLRPPASTRVSTPRRQKTPAPPSPSLPSPALHDCKQRQKGCFRDMEPGRIPWRANLQWIHGLKVSSPLEDPRYEALNQRREGSIFGVECEKCGMLIRVAGNSIMLSPPLIMTPNEVEEML